MLEAQGFHLGFVEGQGCDKEPQKRKDDGFGKGLVRENACCEEQASDEGDEVFHGYNPPVECVTCSPFFSASTTVTSQDFLALNCAVALTWAWYEDSARTSIFLPL